MVESIQAKVRPAPGYLPRVIQLRVVQLRVVQLRVVQLRVV